MIHFSRTQSSIIPVFQHSNCERSELSSKVGKADNIFIFGPGEAKLELAKEIEKIKGQHDRIAAVQASDRLTENQIVAKVKSFFLVSEKRHLP